MIEHIDDFPAEDAPDSSPVAGRDVLREAGIECYDAALAGGESFVHIRRADVERLIAERDEARASDSSARDALNRRGMAAQPLPPQNLDLLERLFAASFKGGASYLTPADRNTLGGLIEYIRASAPQTAGREVLFTGDDVALLNLAAGVADAFGPKVGNWLSESDRAAMRDLARRVFRAAGNAGEVPASGGRDAHLVRLFREAVEQERVEHGQDCAESLIGTMASEAENARLRILAERSEATPEVPASVVENARKFIGNTVVCWRSDCFGCDPDRPKGFWCESHDDRVPLCNALLAERSEATPAVSPASPSPVSGSPTASDVAASAGTSPATPTLRKRHASTCYKSQTGFDNCTCGAEG